MNPSKERQKIVYTSLYKKYLYHLKKVAKQKKRNLLLKSSNNELLKRAIGLRNETQLSTVRNSNLRAEIYDLAMDRKTIMDNNLKLYETLAQLHKDALAIEKKLFNMSDRSSNNEFYERHSSFQMPIVNGQVIRNPKENETQPETSHQKYNFKDCIYVQDLSPIVEENDKPNDVTRRLGHRGKELQPHTSNFSAPEHLGTQTGLVIYEDEDENSNSSPEATRLAKENINLENQLDASEPVIESTGSMNNKGERLSSAVCNQLSNIPADESVQTTPYSSEQSSSSQNSAILSKESASQMCESSVLTNDVLPQSESETNINDLDYRPSIFANVFPRRRKRNDPGCSITVEEEGDSKRHQEPNSTCIEMEDTNLRKCSLRSTKSSLDQSASKIQNNLSSENNSTVNYECKKKERTSKSSFESSGCEQDSISKSSKGEKIKKRGRPAKSNKSSIEVSGCEQDSPSKSFKGEKIKKRGRPAKKSNRSSIEVSGGCSSNKKSSPVSLKKKKNENKVTSCKISERITGQSFCNEQDSLLGSS